MEQVNSNTQINNKDDIKNKKIAFYFNMSSMSPAIELHASLLRDLLSRNNDVTVYLLDRSFKSPSENPFNRDSIFNFAVFRARDALHGLDVPLKFISLDGMSSDIPLEKLATIELGIMSSLASATRAQTKDQLNKKWTNVYDSMFVSAKKLYNYFVDEINTESYDFVFMFNGRFGCVKPVLEAARDAGVGFGLNEVKKTINEVVFVNELVHSIDGNGRRAFEFYEQNPEQAEKDAQEFFGKKLNNENTGDPIYTEFQERGALPDAIIDTDKQVIAVYPTTEDEYKFIGKEWDGHVPESQVDEIDALAAQLSPDEYILVVKMHPNQANSAEKTLERYQEIARKHQHVVVEPPMSKKDTYALMSRADIVITFASTIGVEATYAGKRSILIGDTTWSNMDAAHKVYSGKDAAQLIKNGFDPKPRRGAVIWGYYLLSYKDTLPGYQRVGNGDYYVDGRRIGKSAWRRIMQLPAKFEIETSKPGFTFGKAFITRLRDVAKNIIQGKWAVK